MADFPSNKIEALAFLYVQTRQDLSSRDSSYLLDLYENAYKEINEHNKTEYGNSPTVKTFEGSL